MKCAFDLNSTPNNLNECFGRWMKGFSKPDKKTSFGKKDCNVLYDLEMQK